MIGQRDAVGLVTADGEARGLVPPRSSPGHLSVLCKVLEETEAGGEAPLSGLLHALAERARRRGLVVVLSDGFEPLDALTAALRHLRHRRHEVLFLHVLAPEEEEFPFARPTRFRDLEARDRSLRVDPATFRAAYLERFRAFCRALRESLGRHGGRLPQGLDRRGARADAPGLPRVAIAGEGAAGGGRMTWGVLNAAMLAGLLGVLIPLLVHLWSRRHEEMIDWGAMMFLELGARERRRPRLAGWLLMLTRMALLALVALALARPFWTPSGSAAGADATRGGGGRRDVVLVLDGSASMGRKVGGTTPRALALRWARGFVARLRPGDAVAVVVAGERARALVDPPSADRGRVEAALDGVAASRGSSDLPSALVEAFRILERAPGPGRDVIVLGDGQRFAWRAGEPMRWGLVRDLHRRAPGPPHLWALAFGAGTPPDTPNGSLGPITTSRALVTPGMPVTVTTSLANAGPGPLTRAVELLVDGRAEPGSGRVVGPVPDGGKASLSFRVVPATLGEHLLTVRLVGDDALPGDDEASAPVVVTAALPVLLVDGEPGLEPLSGADRFPPRRPGPDRARRGPRPRVGRHGRGVGRRGARRPARGGAGGRRAPPGRPGRRARPVRGGGRRPRAGPRRPDRPRGLERPRLDARPAGRGPGRLRPPRGGRPPRPPDLPRPRPVPLRAGRRPAAGRGRPLRVPTAGPIAGRRR